jgi:long-chain acyl-CoA synthetase
MTDFAQKLSLLTAPGGAFETVEDPNSENLRFATAPRTLRDLVDGAAEGSRLLWHGERWWTVGEIRARSIDLATSLIEAHGIRPGDRVAILGHNSASWVTAFIAIVGIGAVAVPLNAWWSPAEIAWAVDHAGARLVVGDRRLIGTVAVEVPVVDLDGGVTHRAGEARLDWPGGPPAPDSLATLLYTSGSSGSPKGVVSSHDAVLQAIWAFACRAAVESDEGAGNRRARTLLPVPLFHVTGCITVLLALRAGDAVVLMGRWNPDQALRLIASLRITHVVAVPTQWWDMLSSPALPSADLTSLVRLGGGGAPAPPGLVRRVADLLGPGGVGIGYGMTETNGYGPVNSGPDFVEHPDSCGRVVSIAEVEARDEHLHPLPAGTDGELWFRGPHLATGYWRDPEATASAWVDGWLRTGDIGHVDRSGRVYVTGRRKEMVLRGGENISVVEVEAVLFEHPAVREAAVFGVADDRLGEVVAAVLVRRPGTNLTTAELTEWLDGRIAAYKVPAYVHWSDEPLPRTASGKLLRRPLQESWRSVDRRG